MTTSGEEESARARRLSHGQVCYLQIPAADPMALAAFYEEVFGWHIERPYPSFALPGLIGQFSSDLTPSTGDGLLVWLSVDDIGEAVGKVAAQGGEVVQQPSADGPRSLATVRDPAGNTIGLAQHGPR